MANIQHRKAEQYQWGLRHDATTKTFVKDILPSRMIFAEKSRGNTDGELRRRKMTMNDYNNLIKIMLNLADLADEKQETPFDHEMGLGYRAFTSYWQ